MADLSELGFDATEVEPAVSFDLIPAGKYPCIITESEMVPTKNGNGEFLKITLQIQGGPHDGRLVWDRLNLKNPNEQAVQIARQSLSAICHAVGVLKPKDSADLHNKTLIVNVKCKKRADTGEDTNEVKGYSPYEPSVRPAAPNGQTGKAADPWKR
jgi:hypothetical protein